MAAGAGGFHPARDSALCGVRTGGAARCAGQGRDRRICCGVGRLFGGDEPGFINAALDTIARRKRAAEFGLPVPEGELDF